MTSTTFQIGANHHDVSVNPLEIVSSQDSLNSFLTIPVSFTIKMLGGEICQTNSIFARLKLQSSNTLLSETVLPFFRNLPSAYSLTTSEHLKFTLTDRAIALIEKDRNGDVNLSLDIRITYQKGESKSLGLNSPVIPIWSHSDVVSFSLLVFLPRSTWIERILPHLGYQNLRLVEIPVRHKALNEAYENIVLAFNAAEKSFDLQDYNQCVAQCRHTLEVLNKELKRIDGKFGSKSNFSWLNNTTAETFKWINEMDKQTYRITSKAHHDVSVEYTRSEAQSIYLVVLGLMHYIGNL